MDGRGHERRAWLVRMSGFDRVEREENEHIPRSLWEKRGFGCLRETFRMGLYYLDELRHGIERVHPVYA